MTFSIAMSFAFYQSGNSMAQQSSIATPPPQSITAPGQAVPPEFFGMHIHNSVVIPGAQNLTFTPWPNEPFRTWRFWDVPLTWVKLEPKPGVWNFKFLDQYLALAEQHHVSVLMTLGQTPNWASARPTETTFYRGAAAEPASLSDWDNYIRTLATHCKGRIQAYEIWNEPNLRMFFSGSIPMLAQMSQRAVDIVKQVDPSVTIVSPGITRDPQFLDRYIKAGGLKGVDAVGFHFYIHGQPEDLIPMAAAVKDVLAKNGLTAMPIWDTESGWGEWKDGVNSFTPELASAFVARAYIMHWVTGISRFYWYAWDNHSWVKLQMTQADNTTETPAAQAYRTVQSWMVGSRFQNCARSQDDIWTCSLTRRNRPAWIVWKPEGDSQFVLPRTWHARQQSDLNGNTKAASARITIGPSPLLID